MKSKQNNLAFSAITLGVLTLVLTVFVFAEKTHEGHLPERFDRGVAALIAFIGISGGLFARTRTTPSPAGTDTAWNHDNEYPNNGLSARCFTGLMMAPITSMPGMGCIR